MISPTVFEGLNLALQILDAEIKREPAISGQELAERFRAGVERLDRNLAAATETATCRRCGKPITRIGEEAPWRHTDQDRSRGCRAATFDEGSGWDDSIPRTWTASP